MEKIQPEIYSVLERGELEIRQAQEADPEKAERIRKQIEQLQVCPQTLLFYWLWENWRIGNK